MGLVDIWREKNPLQIIYTWCNMNLSLQSHIAIWLISKDFINLVVDFLMDTVILTDHTGIFIKLDLKDTYTLKYGTEY